MDDMLYGDKPVTYWRESAQPVVTGLRFKEAGAYQLAGQCCACVSFAESG